MSTPVNAASPRRRQRADGKRTREAILIAAARLATVQGIDGLTIGGLAAELGMSKSGLYAHFESKVDLQLAAIAEADRIFDEAVIRPAMEQPTAHARLLALCDNYVQHLRDRVFPGGCFFAGRTLELGSRPGPVREAVAAFNARLSELIIGLIDSAQAEGHLREEDPRALLFELGGHFLQASASVALGDERVLDLAGSVMRRRLEG